MADWIKCSDRMPDEDTAVLIYAPKTRRHDVDICVAKFSRWGCRANEPWWESMGSYGGDCKNDFDSANVTHWMPLPSPPEVQ